MCRIPPSDAWQRSGHRTHGQSRPHRATQGRALHTRHWRPPSCLWWKDCNPSRPAHAPSAPSRRGGRRGRVWRGHHDHRLGVRSHKERCLAIPCTSGQQFANRACRGRTRRPYVLLVDLCTVVRRCIHISGRNRCLRIDPPSIIMMIFDARSESGRPRISCSTNGRRLAENPPEVADYPSESRPKVMQQGFPPLIRNFPDHLVRGEARRRSFDL